MVEVFKTNVQTHNSACEVLVLLQALFPGYKANFDLQDCDRILRIEGDMIKPSFITTWMQAAGYFCEVLE